MSQLLWKSGFLIFWWNIENVDIFNFHYYRVAAVCSGGSSLNDVLKMSCSLQSRNKKADPIHCLVAFPFGLQFFGYRQAHEENQGPAITQGMMSQVMRSQK